MLRRGENVIVQVLPKKSPIVAGTRPTVQKVWDDPKDVFGAPSPDGRYISFTDWTTGDLAIHDLHTGENRRLTNKGSWSDSTDFACKHIWSPDGSQIATSWFRGKDQQYDLRIIDVDSETAAAPRVLYYDQEHYVEPKSWSATTQKILFTRTPPDKTTQLALVSAVDQSVSGIKSLGWGELMDASISPDGRHVVYDFAPLDKEHDIFILNVDGSYESALVDEPGQDYGPIWTADGQRIVFTSDRSGTPSLWVLPVDKGKPAGVPHPVPSDMNRMLSMGMTRDGSYFYANENRRGGESIYVVDFEPQSGQCGTPTLLEQRFAGFNSRPAWSPNGEELAYVSDRGPFPASSSLIIRDLESGHERVVKPRLDSFVFRNIRPVWSTDAGSLLFSGGHDGRWRWGVFMLDAETGDVSPLTQLTTDGGKIPGSAVRSPDGKTLYYIHRGADGERSILTLDLKTGEEKRLYKSGAREADGDNSVQRLHSLALSAEGKWLAFAGENAICILPTGGGDVRVACRAPANERILAAVGLVWTSEHDLLLYGTAQPQEGANSNLPHKNTRLWKVPAHGGNPVDTGLVIDDLSHISLHPNGRRLAFSAAESDDGATLHGIWAISNFLPNPKAKLN